MHSYVQFACSLAQYSFNSFVLLSFFNSSGNFNCMYVHILYTLFYINKFGKFLLHVLEILKIVTPEGIE